MRQEHVSSIIAGKIAPFHARPCDSSSLFFPPAAKEKQTEIAQIGWGACGGKGGEKLSEMRAREAIIVFCD